MTGKQFIETRLLRGVTVREENAVAALEVMSRFALHPKWLLYLPPTMSPTETSSPAPTCSSTRPKPSPTIRSRGVGRVVCEEKHMGSARGGGAGPATRPPCRRRLGAGGRRASASATPAPAATSSPIAAWKPHSWPACATP
ncbi:MAG: hypothetical protein WKG07_20555 [Hymenobacter sp.]